MTRAPQPMADVEVSLAKLISNTAEEMQRLSRTADALDETLGIWLEERGDTPPPVSLLQDVDLLRQSLACLSVFLVNLSRHPLPNHQLSGSDVTAGVFLGQIREACLRGSVEY